MDAVNNYLKRTLSVHTFEDGYKLQTVRPRMQCKDGFSISLQASAFNHCKPRVDGDCEYEEVELGYPSREEPLIIEFADEPDRPTDTVYGYVPIDVVNKLIEKHGGIVI